MLKNFRHRAQNFIDRMANNPAEASRAVFVSLLIIGICSLSLDLGEQVFPESFEARLLDPLDRTTLKTAQDLDDANNDPDEKLVLIDACKTARADNDYGTFLESFEKSFAGILPGAGNLLLEHPSTVSDRREKLIFEVMKNYAELKFCIPSDQFKVIYLADYRNVFGELNFFFQVFLVEEYPDEYLITEINDVFIDTAMREYILVEKDLVSTQKYVTEIIDRAIESAIELDQQTQKKLVNLVARTSNQLTAVTNAAIATNTEAVNQGNIVSASIAGILDNIRSINAVENIFPGPMLLGGTWTTTPYEKTIAMYLSMAEGNISAGSKETEITQPGLGNIIEIGKKVEEILSSLSYGLMDLLDPNMQEELLFERLGLETVMYVGATYMIDPFVPSAVEELRLDIIMKKIEAMGYDPNQTCPAIHDPDGSCYLREVNPA